VKGLRPGRAATVVAGQPPLLKVLDVDPPQVGAELVDPALVAPCGGMSVAPEGGPVFVTHAGGIAVVDLAADPAALGAPVRAGVACGPCAAAFGGAVLFALNPATGLVDRIATRLFVVTVAFGPLRVAPLKARTCGGLSEGRGSAGRPRSRTCRRR
jgi:hypothetical protein